MGGKLLNDVKSMYVNSLAHVKGGENECFRVNSGVRRGCTMSPWLFSVYMDAVMKEVKMERREESGDCLTSCMQMTYAKPCMQNLGMMVGRFAEMCRKEV